jgi:hypothetical protein
VTETLGTLDRARRVRNVAVTAAPGGDECATSPSRVGPGARGRFRVTETLGTPQPVARGPNVAVTARLAAGERGQAWASHCRVALVVEPRLLLGVEAFNV